jgi:hypothetical protein
MIKIEYNIKFPNGVDPTTFFPIDIATKLSESRSLAANELGAIFDRLYDPTTNTLTMIYLWPDQETVDLFYEKVMEKFDYQQLFTDVQTTIESAGGTFSRVRTEI